MQITLKSVRHGGRGFALIITLIFLAVMLTVFGSMMYWVSSNASVSLRNNQFNMSEAAAEAAIEKALSQMDHDFLNQSLSSSSSYSSLLPNQTNAGNVWPVQYVYSDTNGNTGQISVNMGSWSATTQPLNSQYSGLYGLVMPVTLTATATPQTGQIGVRYTVPATVSESLQFASIPLFQFAIFYNINLEIDPGASMPINGPVFSNRGLWSGNDDVTYNSSVSAVGTVYYSANSASGDPFDSLKTDSGTTIGNFASTPINNANALTMPIAGVTNNDPTNVESILQLPPPAYAMGTAAGYHGGGTNYLANEADLYITNSASGTNSGNASWIPYGTNTIIYYSDPANTPYLTKVVNNYFILSNITTHALSFSSNPNTNTLAQYKAGAKTNIYYAGYSFVTNVAFYDWREGWNSGNGIGGKGKAVQAVQIDISLLNIWLTNTLANANGGYVYNQQCQLGTHKSHAIDSIYVYNSVPLTGTTLPAVRVVNGSKLPSASNATTPNGSTHGLTIATPFPIYVLGNYNVQTTSGSQLGQLTNTAYTYPAAFMADAITILSTSWSDSSPTTKCPNAGDTTVNAGCLEGIVQSTNSIYSGGVENFLRLLENWSGNTLTYNGSIVVMFPSQYATNYQVPPNNGYYNAPTRAWGFDSNFAQQGGLPPLTPQSKAVIRGNWNAY